MSLLIPAWFILPWLIFAAKVIQASIYEMRLGLTKDLPPFAFAEMMRRINERRASDPAYDHIKGETYRWLKITAVWWVTSFAILVGGALLYGHFKP